MVIAVILGGAFYHFGWSGHFGWTKTMDVYTDVSMGSIEKEMKMKI
jgi:hypothetical protein